MSSWPHRYSRTLAIAGISLVGMATSSCGNPLASLPADTVAAAFAEIVPEEARGFAFISLQAASCIQLAPETQFRFEGIEPIWMSLGGRQNNPLAAYVDVGCELPNANWDLAQGGVEAPLLFEVAEGEVTLTMEVDSEGDVTRCDFPACTFDGPPPGERLAPR